MPTKSDRPYIIYIYVMHTSIVAGHNADGHLVDRQKVDRHIAERT